VRPHKNRSQVSKYFLNVPPVISLVADSSRLNGDWAVSRRLLIEAISSAAEIGIDLIQIREKMISDAELFDYVKCAVKCVKNSETRILVNDRVDIALAAGAAGVHLKENSVRPERIRSIVPEDWVVGLSVHYFGGGLKEVDEGCLDYVAIGNVFETISKPGKTPIGIEGLAEAVKKYSLPVLGIGGINLNNLSAVSQTGARGFSAIGLFASVVGSEPKVLSDLVFQVKMNWSKVSDR